LDNHNYDRSIEVSFRVSCRVSDDEEDGERRLTEALNKVNTDMHLRPSTFEMASSGSFRTMPNVR
jgi:hypothetical protein